MKIKKIVINKVTFFENGEFNEYQKSFIKGNILKWAGGGVVSLEIEVENENENDDRFYQE